MAVRAPAGQPFFSRPENALKRAEELVNVSQSVSALQLLYDVIMSKRARSTPLTSLEPIVIRFIEMSVEQRKGRLAKEVMHQYKNISQNTSVTTIEMVIKRFVDLAEAKVMAAQSKADALAIDQIEDLEATETPESIMLSTVSGEGNKDRTDREVVTPWLKFLWEAYRTVLDILRNNARLEVLYQMIANQAFQFCLRYQRKTEFRRLCDLLRSHLATAAKYQHQPHAVNLSDPDTLQRHLDTRFVQLNAAADLELWQEAFRSIEDIHNLLSMSKKAPKPFMMANYYEKLAKIFLVGDNQLFHAAACNKYYATVRQNKNMSEEEQSRMASVVLISILSIPIITTAKARSEYDDKSRVQRLTNLLRANRAPSREALLREVLSRNILSRVRPEVKELYDILEVHFHPLSICQKIAPIISSLAENEELAKYVKPLHQVVLTRVLQQLSQVYTTVQMDFVVKLLAFGPPYDYDAHAVEKFIMNGCRKGELNIRVNHTTRSVTFETDPFAAAKGSISEGPKLQALPSEQMRLQLVKLGKRMQTVINLIDPSVSEKLKQEKVEAIKIAVQKADEERKIVGDRIRLIERKKERRETEAARKDQEKQREQQLRKKQEAEAEKIRLAEEEKRRELERLNQQRQEVEKAQAKKLAEKLAEEMKQKNLKIKKEELESLDTKRLMEIQLEQLEQEKKELQNKMKQMAKRYDHVERAFRKEEVPILLADYEKQKLRDQETHRELLVKARQDALQKFEEDKLRKERVLRLMDDFVAMKGKLEERGSKEYAAAQAAAEAELKREKAQRRHDLQLRKAVARKRAEWEEEQERIREEEERKAREAEERAAEEKRLRAEKERAEYDERRRKLDEQAARQAERERLAEEKIRATALAQSKPFGRESPLERPTSAEGPSWKRREHAGEGSPADEQRGEGNGDVSPESGGGQPWRPKRGPGVAAVEEVGASRRRRRPALAVGKVEVGEAC
ncbi:hypothetical protein DFJ74DRAFT_773295 [Hyaloraphidium curvatum]|nr:hypothetical protein DFJ74DRAFT_773295 [Hyaloraphidium curvatum]